MPGSTPAYRDAQPLLISHADAHTTMPPQSVRRTTHPLPGRKTLADTLSSMQGFLAHRMEATSSGRLHPYELGPSWGRRRTFGFRFCAWRNAE